MWWIRFGVRFHFFWSQKSIECRFAESILLVYFYDDLKQIKFELSDLKSVYLVAEWRRERLLARNWVGYFTTIWNMHVNVLIVCWYLWRNAYWQFRRGLDSRALYAATNEQCGYFVEFDSLLWHFGLCSGRTNRKIFSEKKRLFLKNREQLFTLKPQ